MAVKVKAQKVLDLVKAGKLIYWKIYNGKNRLWIQTEDISPDDSAEQLEDFLNNCEGNSIIVKLCSSPEFKSNRNEDYEEREFEISLISKAISADTAGSERLLREVFELKQQIAEERNARQLDDLRKELKDNSGIGAIIEATKDHLPQLVPAILGFLQGKKIIQQPHLAGPPQQATYTSEDVQNARARINTALRQLANVDDNYIEVLEALAHIATNDTSTYNQYRPIIISMNKN